MDPPLWKKLLAEFLGTYWLVLGGCGSAVFAAAFPYMVSTPVIEPDPATDPATTALMNSLGSQFAAVVMNKLGIAFLGVSLAFGLTVLTMAYAVGHVSGGHFNPAVSVGCLAAGRTPVKDVAAYIVVQVVAGIAAGGTLNSLASGREGFEKTGSNPLATNGYDEHSPGLYSLGGAFLAEAFLTFMFLIIILGSTDKNAPAGFAPIPIGFALTLIHLISIPVTNTSVNPARSLGVAVFAGGGNLKQVWLFWVAPILGAGLAGVVHKMVLESRDGDGTGIRAPMVRKCIAEVLGTMWLVFGGCGSAVLAAVYPYTVPVSAADDANPLVVLLSSLFGSGNKLGLGFLGVSLAFGLTVLTMAYAVGHISGGHFNPAVSVGCLAAGRTPAKDVAAYVLAQCVGGAIGGGVLYGVANARPGFEIGGGNPFATNGYGTDHSPGGYGAGAAFVTEVLMTFFFLVIILGSTDAEAPSGFAPIPIGFALTLIHLISIPVTNTSVNPARSLGAVLYAGDGELWAQLWMFWVAPILGAALAGALHRFCLASPPQKDTASDAASPLVTTATFGQPQPEQPPGGAPALAPPGSGAAAYQPAPAPAAKSHRPFTGVPTDNKEQRLALIRTGSEESAAGLTQKSASSVRPPTALQGVQPLADPLGPPRAQLRPEPLQSLLGGSGWATSPGNPLSGTGSRAGGGLLSPVSPYSASNAPPKRQRYADSTPSDTALEPGTPEHRRMAYARL